ncbi:MAG: hypothetical protein ACK2UK_15745 [Candidatus Promineifilaceae bacterium]
MNEQYRDQYDEEGVDRRSFLRNLSLAALAATAAGAGAAFLAGREPGEVVISSGPSAPAVVQTLPPVQAVPAVQSAQMAVQASQDATQLLARLAEAQAENVRLRSALDAAQRDLDSLRLANSDGSAATQDLSLQLASANEQIGILGGLVALYEELDAADVTDSIQAGINTVSGTIANLMDSTPTLSEGIAAGEQALAEVEAHLPALEDGRMWLDAQINKLDSFYQAVQMVLQNALDSLGSFLEMVEEWFSGVRKWLPFGIGEKAASVVGAFADLVEETPRTIAGLNDFIVQPLDLWLERSDGEPALKRTLVKPIRERVLLEADKAIVQAQQVNNDYQVQVAQPVAQAKSQRDEMRRRIDEYRQQYLA